MAESTVSAGFARGLMELAVKKGARRAALAERSGVRLEDLDDQDSRIPFASYVALMRAAKALAGDPALALHYGETVDIAKVSILGLIGQASENMSEAFAQLNRYVPLVVETENADGGDRFRMMGDRDGFWIVDARNDPNEFPELTESAFAQLICAPRRFDETPVAKAVHLTHADPGYRDEYERIFRAPVVFGADKNGILVHGDWMQRRIAHLPRYAFGILSERADALLQSLENSKSTRGRVEGVLMPILHTGDASMDRVARQMAVSRQTLFRRLKAEGVTFAGVLDELRHRLALHYLNGRKVSVNETAYLVGFSDPAAFSRAFKRWTGCSPRQMRASKLVEDRTAAS
ncbi:AraC family transcriptional regulator [Phenylobacterium sp.]|uniref:AraC family transcriptional regulator n=1 Tax=Phenylobacterium sp. TaxID=1871053 RepID=UPI002FC6FED9